MTAQELQDTFNLLEAIIKKERQTFSYLKMIARTEDLSSFGYKNHEEAFRNIMKNAADAIERLVQKHEREFPNV